MAGEASRRRPGLRHLRRGGRSTRLRPSPSPASTPEAASAFPLIAHSADPPQGAAFLPGDQLERPLPWPGRARLPVHLRVLRATTPAAVLSPPRATRIRSRTACNRRAAPLPSIVGAGSEDPCAICPEICGVTRLEPYVATRRGGGRLAEGSSSHISWCVHCIVWFLYLRRCRSRGHAVQGATRSGRTRTRPCVGSCEASMDTLLSGYPPAASPNSHSSG